MKSVDKDKTPEPAIIFLRKRFSFSPERKAIRINLKERFFIQAGYGRGNNICHHKVHEFSWNQPTQLVVVFL